MLSTLQKLFVENKKVGWLTWHWGAEGSTAGQPRARLRGTQAALRRPQKARAGQKQENEEEFDPCNNANIYAGVRC